MILVTLADGNQKQYAEPVTAQQVAENIGSGLAKAALAALVNDKLVDLSHPIRENASVKIITAKDPQGLAVIRHSTAHLLAQAVKALFPEAQVTIGPVIEDGFYYDFACDHHFTPEDLELIETKMHELVKADLSVQRKVFSREAAIQVFSQMGEFYKVKIIEEIPADQTITAYQQGDFVDLCRGPHVARTGQLGAFKLTKVSGAYWRGDPNNEMLQRVYGTAWGDNKALKEYLHRLDQAEKRDHRVIAKKMDLFHLQPEAPGMIFWHPNGWALIRTIREYLREKLHRFGYEEVNTPQLVDVTLWQQSGHMEKFADDLFLSHSENRQYAIKPMSCPCHIQIFKQGLKSYRDLPIRMTEFGSCHRNEFSGTLHGLLRVRGFVQDDGHIFCTPAQIQSEVLAFIEQLRGVYHDFGYTDIVYKLSTRPEQRIGSDEQWDIAEKALADALTAAGVEWQYSPGEGGFYAPKVEFSLRDCLGRLWQCGTIQVDFFLGARLGAYYIDEDGTKQTPVMLHRAILGSLERFVGILLEHYAERLPLWLAPIQAVIMNITDRQTEFCDHLKEILTNQGFRVKLDLRNEKIGFKIREHTLARTPYQLVIGDREVADRSVSLRQLGSDLSVNLKVEELVNRLQQEIRSKR
ncbi:MAG: threonine--tRNA ligase [Proteobacteria bacterium]|nr:threonine--tRNA ligase [Pseudomonadota bacterium]